MGASYGAAHTSTASFIASAFINLALAPLKVLARCADEPLEAIALWVLRGHFPPISPVSGVVGKIK